mmetsp:Transcript_21211/g.34310  ORF Transcript_21211/g.34310 Transcript_21211/m.34310 type:complete len:89 (-) Transcript_21211:867-1133(-)
METVNGFHGCISFLLVSVQLKALLMLQNAQSIFVFICYISAALFFPNASILASASSNAGRYVAKQQRKNPGSSVRMENPGVISSFASF